MIPQGWLLVFKIIIYTLYICGFVGLLLGLDLLIDLILIRTF